MLDGVTRAARQPLILACALTLLTSNSEAQAQGHVDVALVFAVDCSGSVDAREYDLQMSGIAKAFRDPEIIDAIERWAPNGLAVSVVHWSGWHAQQVVALDWTTVGDRGSAATLATAIETMERALSGDTSIGGLLRFTTDYIARAPFQSARWIVDVSGDGTPSSGDQPDRYRDNAVAKGIVINGLAVLNEFPNLDQYYADHVIGGPEAFVVAARDYEDLARAMRIKMLQEISGAPLG